MQPVSSDVSSTFSASREDTARQSRNRKTRIVTPRRKDAKIFKFLIQIERQSKAAECFELHKRFSRNCILLRHSTAKIHIRKSVHDAFDAIFHQVASEVKDKAESQPFELQIGEELLRSELSYGFGLYFVVHGKTQSRQDF